MYKGESRKPSSEPDNKNIVNVGFLSTKKAGKSRNEVTKEKKKKLEERKKKDLGNRYDETTRTQSKAADSKHGYVTVRGRRGKRN